MIYQFEPSGRLKAPSPEELAAADAETAVLVLNRGALADGNPYWAYMAVLPSKYREFMEATEARRPVCLKDYGAIVKYGYDANVPDGVREEMRREYGFDEQYMASVTKRVLEAQAAFLQQQRERRISDFIAMAKKKQSH